MTGRRLLIRSLQVCGKVRYAATKTLSVLSGTVPRKWIVPHAPTRARAQIGSGGSPPSHAGTQPAFNTTPAANRKMGPNNPANCGRTGGRPTDPRFPRGVTVI